MILVCDRCVSLRANILREELLTRGYPCAVAAFSDISKFLPIKVIVSFEDVFDEILYQNTDDIRRVVVRCDQYSTDTEVSVPSFEMDVFTDIISLVEETYGITEAKRITFCCSPSIFLLKKFFTLNGNVIEPTKSEYMILKYLFSLADSQAYFPPEQIARFCFSADKITSVSSVVVHVANLNKKIASVYSGRLIRSKRCRGYYAVKI